MILIFNTSLILILTVWFIYPLILKIAPTLSLNRNKLQAFTQVYPDVSVIIAAHNESRNLEKRCKNIFSQNYNGNIEIVIASDGSSDNTIEVVDELKEKFSNIIFLDIQPQGGRSNAHNLAIEQAHNEILIFTDAETVFNPDFITEITKPFSDKNTGFVSGMLKYFNANTNMVSESVSLYWKLEMFLRKAESQLGLYATGTGACCAVRKSLYCTIPATGDVDFITPLDTVLQGFKCVHRDEAIAWDELSDTPKKEFVARIRMTSKNIKGTLSRWGILAIFKHPLYSISLFFHKIGRWLTPFFLIGLFISSALLLLDTSNLFITVVFLLQVAFYLLGLVGYLKINFLYSQQVYSFLLANLGFLLGVLKAVFGKTPHLYKPVSQQKNL
jgi:cellulose synthase/poly-beta-1,6-N-acetylglucosamine synthase-like glycosyltransferase